MLGWTGYWIEAWRSLRSMWRQALRLLGILGRRGKAGTALSSISGHDTTK